MTVNDPIADMLTRVRNATMAGHVTTAMPNSKIKVAIAEILKSEGYIESYKVVDGQKEFQKILRLRIKYVGERRSRRPVIDGLERISRPGRRVYAKRNEIPWVLSGIGTAILSTSKGVMTGKRARQMGVGGEILCKVW